MGILDNESKAILVESMRNSLCNVLQESTQMTAAEATQHQKFVNESATYEQLLNITFNPDRETNYLPDYVLEGAAAVLHRACLTGRKYIGPNAIMEGALKLHHETGAVITESMLDAAYNTVTRGRGLQIIGESILLAEAKKGMISTIKKSTKDATKAATKAVKAAKKTITKTASSSMDAIGKWFKNLGPVKKMKKDAAVKKSKATKAGNALTKQQQKVADDHDFNT